MYLPSGEHIAAFMDLTWKLKSATRFEEKVEADEVIPLGLGLSLVALPLLLPLIFEAVREVDAIRLISCIRMRPPDPAPAVSINLSSE